MRLTDEAYAYEEDMEAQAHKDRDIMPGAGDAAREEEYNDEHMTARPADKGSRSSEESQ